MHIALWIAQVILAAAFLMAGMTKAFQYEKAKASLPWVQDVPKGLTTLIGSSELLGGLGLLLPMLTGIAPVLTPVAAAALGLVMVLAAIFHSRRREWQAVVFNIVLLSLALFVAYGRFVAVPV